MPVRNFSAGSNAMHSKSYFTVFTPQKAILYGISALYVTVVALAAIIEPFTALPCDHDEATLKFDQPYYDANPCRQARFIQLLFLTRDECSYGRRLLAALLLGGIVGWERRSADRPAGIRTMALVSLGSSLFTICSAFAFNTSPQGWDASRISAAIPSGVGFLGAGLIFKENTSDDSGPSHVVHGLTTAASLWLSAAVGIACGGELYFSASLGTALILLLLRFGPRNSDFADDDIEKVDDNYESVRNDETASLVSSGSMLRQSLRSRASLATMV